jgi:hypothetical protein
LAFECNLLMAGGSVERRGVPAKPLECRVSTWICARIIELDEEHFKLRHHTMKELSPADRTQGLFGVCGVYPHITQTTQISQICLYFQRVPRLIFETNC